MEARSQAVQVGLVHKRGKGRVHEGAVNKRLDLAGVGVARVRKDLCEGLGGKQQAPAEGGQKKTVP